MTLKTNQNVEAEIRAEKKMGFLIHAFVFLAVNAGLVTLNLTKNPENLWCFWALGGWGLGLAFHGMRVFSNGSLKKKFVEREASRQEREMAKH